MGNIHSRLSVIMYYRGIKPFFITKLYFEPLRLILQITPVFLVVSVFLFWPQLTLGATVSVTLPNGGECLTVSVKYTITASFDSDHVALYYKTDGMQPTHLGASLIKHPMIQSTYKWTPSSGDISTTGRIWAEGHDNDHTSTLDWDDSNANFEVSADCSGGDGDGDVTAAVAGGGPLAHRPSVTISSPKEGEVFGTVVSIVYIATDENDELNQSSLGFIDNPVSIYYVAGSDIRNRELIVEGLTATGTYSWKARELPNGDDYRIIVRAVDKVGEVGEAVSPFFSLFHSIPFVDGYSTGAVVVWQTNNPNFSFIEYGTSSKMYTSTTLSSYPNLSTQQYVLLRDLVSSTTYYFRTVTGATLGEKIRSDEYSFITLPRVDVTRPSSPSGTFGEAGETTTLLSWLKSADANYFYTTIVRREDRFAKHVEDLSDDEAGGAVISTSTALYQREESLKRDTKYYYSIFHTDKGGGISLPTGVVLETSASTEEIPIPPGDENVPTLPRVTSPSIERVTDNEITIRWKNPDSQNFVGVHIVRNDESLPGNPFDGETVFRGRTEILIDSGLAEDTPYFYGLFVFDWNNLYSPAAFISAKTTSPTVLVTATTTTATTTATSTEDIPATTTASTAESTGKTTTSTEARIMTMQTIIESIKAEIVKLVDIIQNMLLQMRLGVEGRVHVIHIDTLGFSPNNITIASGDTVLWVNDDLLFSWPASDLHPTHSLHPTTGGCSHSGFDTCRGLSIGDEFAFTFIETGAFGYHDHTYPTLTGKIIVTE